MSCETKFTRYLDFYDGRDLYQEILEGKDWAVSTNLQDILVNLPSFITKTKKRDEELLAQQEAQNSFDPIDHEVYGTYHLEAVYNLAHFQNTSDPQRQKLFKGRHAGTCSVFAAEEQEEGEEEEIILQR